MRAIAALAMLAALAVGGSVGQAAEPEHFAKRLFAEGLAPTGKSHACFVRRYDTAHLAKHGKQKVKAMKLLVAAEVLPEDKELNYSFQLAPEFRDRPGKFSTAGSCGHPTASEQSADKLQLGCGVDCDGGGIAIELADNDNSGIVRLDSVAIWDDGKPDDERGRLDGGADDRVFRLDRASLDECKSLLRDDENPGTM